MGFCVGANAFKGGDVAILYASYLRPAGPNRHSAGDDRAGAALGEPTAEFRSRKLEVVAQRIEERRIALQRDLAESAVHTQMVGFWHGGSSPRPQPNIPRGGRSVKPPAEILHLPQT